MRIIIAGAGDVGFHLAELLATENQDITLIDNDQEVLEYAGSHLDVLTMQGDAASIGILHKARVGESDLVLAVTTSEKTNLMTAILAKKLGAQKVIARVNSEDYYCEENNGTICSLGIDHLISPRQLAANEIERLIKQCSFTDVFEFEEGKLSLVGVTIENNTPLENIRLMDIDKFESEVDLRPICILRGHKTIIPRGDTVIRRHDHVYFITRPDRTKDLEEIIGAQKIDVKRIMILGGSDLAMATARRLQDKYRLTLVEKNKNRCKKLSAKLQNTLVIHGDYTNFDLLEEEGLNNMDAFIALTENSETNIISCLTAENHGVFKTIAQVENKEYVHISQNIGVDTLINKKLIAANNIFRFVRKGRVEAITSLHGVEAEVIEYAITKNNQLTRKPLKDLHFPDTALVGGVIRGEQSMIPDGSFQMELNDKVIVFALPEAIPRLETLFR
ncbi:Trk system potassium transporter TrkA [Lewinellaceae bacterium SD302]|nr:Trk system potassium transporter TrkA [Lewinellaceae bacterium SD302]